jgi:hypothetical protein
MQVRCRTLVCTKSASGNIAQNLKMGRFGVDAPPTFRADSRPSLQVRGGSASTARADIHIAEELSFFLQCGKAAWSPKGLMLRIAEMAASAYRYENLGIHLC